MRASPLDPVRNDTVIAELIESDRGRAIIYDGETFAPKRPFVRLTVTSRLFWFTSGLLTGLGFLVF